MKEHTYQSCSFVIKYADALLSRVGLYTWNCPDGFSGVSQANEGELVKPPWANVPNLHGAPFPPVCNFLLGVAIWRGQDICTVRELFKLTTENCFSKANYQQFIYFFPDKKKKIASLFSLISLILLISTWDNDCLIEGCTSCWEDICSISEEKVYFPWKYWADLEVKIASLISGHGWVGFQ